MAAENIGRITKVSVGIEAVSYGTKAASVVSVPVMDFDPAPKKEIVQDDSAAGRIEKGLQTDTIKEWSEPTLTTVVRNENLGYFLKAIFGTVATTGPTDTVAYTHAFTVKNDNTPVSMSILFEDSNEEEAILGCVVNTASVQMVSEDYTKLTLSFIGKKQVTDTNTPSYTADRKFTSKMSTVKFATTVAGLGAASTIPFQSASYEINKNAEAIFGIGSTEPTKIINKAFEMTGSFTIVQNSETYRNLFLANTVQSMLFSCADTVVLTGGSSQVPTFTTTIAKAYINEYSAPRGVDDLVSEDFSFVASYDLSDNMVDAELINLTTSY